MLIGCRWMATMMQILKAGLIGWNQPMFLDLWYVTSLSATFHPLPHSLFILHRNTCKQTKGRRRRKKRRKEKERCFELIIILSGATFDRASSWEANWNRRSWVSKERRGGGEAGRGKQGEEAGRGGGGQVGGGRRRRSRRERILTFFF